MAQEQDNDRGDYAERIYEKLEREDRLNYERIKIQDEIRQTVLSWGVAGLAAMGAFLSGAAYFSYDQIIDTVAATIEESLDEKVNVALETKLTEANRRMEAVFLRSDEVLNRELDEIRTAKTQVSEAVIEARSAIASLEAQTDFVRSAAVRASDAAVESTRAAEASRQKVEDIAASLAAGQEELEAKALQFAKALGRAEGIQERIREAIQKLNDERVSLSAELASLNRRQEVVEEILLGLNGSLENNKVAELRAQELVLKELQGTKIILYVSKWNQGADVPEILELHDKLVAKGIPNDPYATEKNTDFQSVAAEIDGDFTGVQRFLKGETYQLFANPASENLALMLLDQIASIDPDLEIELLTQDFSVTQDDMRKLPRGDLAPIEKVMVLTKMPPMDF
ncbi:MAG: hypothetical protein ACFB0F_00590 [Neomegalonema sp.]